jgi:hypothetical protein
VGRILVEKYGGHFSRLLDLAAGSAVALLGSVLAEFPCFRQRCGTVTIFYGSGSGSYF